MSWSTFLVGIGMLFCYLPVYGQEVLEPVFNLPYVIIYGRDDCLFTLNMRKELKRANVQYYYRNVDSVRVIKQLYPRMLASGLSIQRKNIPIVDVNGYILVQPNPTTIVDKYLFE